MGDVKRLLRTNFESYDGKVWLITVTAPGFDVLPDEDEISIWNATCPHRWSVLHRKSSQYVKRQGLHLTFLGRVIQAQKRGALHVHVVVGVETRAEQVGAWLYSRELKRLAGAAGFGYVDARNQGEGSTVMEAGQAAYYLSKYLSESSQLGEAIARGVRRPIVVSQRLTQQTGCTMRRLRRVRLLYWIRRGESSIVARAGHLPAWFRDSRELMIVQSLAAAPGAP